MKLLLVTPDRVPAAVLPALGLLDHVVAVASPCESASALADPEAEAVLVDTRRDPTRAFHALAAAKRPVGVPVLAVVEDTGLVAVSPSWHVADFLLRGAGPAEIDARLRLRQARPADQVDLRSDPTGRNPRPEVLSVGDLVVDPGTYTVHVGERALSLTFKEFELLRHLVAQPDRIHSRPQLLRHVWGYESFVSTRTVDIHVRRLRAKLGPDHGQMIVTVRRCGYKIVTPAAVRPSRPGPGERPARRRRTEGGLGVAQ